MPFLCFKDNANRINPNAHQGLIRSSNLCTEIFQNTAPNHYKIKVVFADGSERLFEENEEVRTDVGIVKKAKKITALDTLGGKEIFIVEKGCDEGATAVCNLASVNLSKINSREEITRVMPMKSVKVFFLWSNLPFSYHSRPISWPPRMCASA